MPSPATMPSSSTSTSTASLRTNLRTIAPSDGSRTLVIAQPGHGEEGNRDESPRQHPPSGTLRLRGGPRSRPQVAWDVGVVDNENMGKKKSKICCIYHKPKAFDESSDEDSSSDSESDNDSAASDNGRARPSQRSRRQHHCSRDDRHHNSTQHSTDSSVITQHQHHQHHHHPDKPNAYEVQPLIKGKGHGNGN